MQERCAAVASGGEQPDHVPVRRFGQWVDGDPLAGERERVLGVARPVDRRCERVGEAGRERVTRLVDPVVVDAREQLAVAQREGVLDTALGAQVLELARVDPHLGVAREPDPVARRGKQVRRAAQRRAQRGERDAQARPRAFVEHVGPEARCDLGPRMQPRIERQPCEQRPHAPPRGRLDPSAAGLDGQIPEDEDPQCLHAPSLRRPGAPDRSLPPRLRAVCGGRTVALQGARHDPLPNRRLLPGRAPADRRVVRRARSRSP